MLPVVLRLAAETFDILYAARPTALATPRNGGHARTQSCRSFWRGSDAARVTARTKFPCGLPCNFCDRYCARRQAARRLAVVASQRLLDSGPVRDGSQNREKVWQTQHSKQPESLGAEAMTKRFGTRRRLRTMRQRIGHAWTEAPRPDFIRKRRAGRQALRGMNKVVAHALQRISDYLVHTRK